MRANRGSGYDQQPPKRETEDMKRREYGMATD